LVIIVGTIKGVPPGLDTSSPPPPPPPSTGGIPPPPPPPPVRAPPPPPSVSPPTSQSGGGAFPWTIFVKKGFILPGSDFKDAVDLELTYQQVISF